MSDMRFGRYTVINSLGRGGMAEVYRAYDPMLDRYVAVKVILPHLATDEKFEERFLQEAKLVASLGHPNIVKIFDFGVENDQPYMVMEYLGYGTLKDRISELSDHRRTMSLDNIESILMKMANALDYAHQKGAIHRDIKPANILFSSSAEPILTDFGIAKIFADTGHITVTGGIVGSPKYMSPEQAASEPVGIFSDIYSLGIVIYEMATGRTPFQGESITGVLMQHLNSPPPPPRNFNPNIPQAVQATIIKSLAKKPDERYGSAIEFARTFASSLQGESLPPISQIAETIANVPQAIAIPSPRTDEPETIQDEVPLKDSLRTMALEAEGIVHASPPRKLPRVGLIAGLLVLIGVLSIGGFLLFGGDLFKPERSGQTPELGLTLTPAQGQIATQFMEQTDESSIPSTPGTPASPVGMNTAAIPSPPQKVTRDPQWTSWTAGNILSSVEIWGNLVVAGGWGGIVFRDRESGDYWQITTGDGLAGVEVLSLFVDTDNTLWVGTAEGLQHFTGDERALYNREDGLDSSYVTAMIRYDGNLLVGTQSAGVDGGGLNIFDGRSWRQFEGFPSKYEDPGYLSTEITSMTVDRQGGLWVGTTNGLAHYDGETWVEYNAANSELPASYIKGLYVDDLGNLWAGTDYGAARFEEGAFRSFTALSEFTVNGIVQDQDGDFWFSGVGGIVHFSPDIGDWEYLNAENTNLKDTTYYEAVLDENGTLYFGSEDAGLISYSDGNFNELTIPNLPAMASFGRIIPYQDATLMFVEEWGSGSDIIDPLAETWAPMFDLPCCSVPYLFDDSGNLWGISDEGLSVMRPDGSTTNWTTEDGLPSDKVKSLAFDPQNLLWVGTESGVAVFDPVSMAVTAVYDTSNGGFTDNQVHSLLQTSDGSMWVGTDFSLNRLLPDGNWEQFTKNDPFSDNLWAITDIAEDADGGLWVTTFGDGVYYYGQGEWEHFDPDFPGANFPSYDVKSVTIAPNGDVWFGTDYSGAVLYREGQWRTFDVEDGLIHSNVTDVYIDGEGAVWFATSGGVSRFNQSTAPDSP